MKSIPINKGNYDMDTEERRAAFSCNIGYGWEDEYKEYRKNWIKYAEEQILSEYPLLLDLELSSLCNLKCPMCYTITEEFKQKVNATLMSIDLYKSIIDEICGKISAIRLSLRGEPTIHPDFIECIRYAKEKGIKEISFLTNGSKLDIEMINQLVELEVEWFTVSIDGIYDTYESIRKPLKFNDTLEKLKIIKSIKDAKGVKKPVIKIQSVWPAISNNAQEYYNIFKDVTDLIAFNPLIDYLGKDIDIVYEKGFSCPQLYQRLVIGADGCAMMCSNDEENSIVVGNANEESIYSIWHGEKLSTIRQKHKEENGFLEFKVCRKCYLPRKTDDSESFFINNNEYKIKNYIMRSQEIGE